MKIAYFINQYPKVSHSFIRREILALERQGFEVLRIALRGWQDQLVDSEDIAERQKTRYVLQAGVVPLLLSILKMAFLRPVRFASALGLAIQCGRRADRGVLLHLIYLAEACRILPWLEQYGAMHVHAHFGTNPAAVVMLAYALGGAEYSFTVHGPEEFDKPEFLHLSEKIKRSKFVVAISSFGKSQLMRWIPYAQWHKPQVVHCGLEQGFYNVTLPALTDKPRMVCVGRLCEQKGQQLLVQAAKQLAFEGIDFELVLAGDGEMRPEIEKLISEYRLDEKVKITGWISGNQVREEMLNSRVMVLPSFAEGLPVVIMEAMSLKRPVISTYVAGIPELVKHGDNGWLVPAGSVDDLVVAMREALSLPAIAVQTMGERARDAVLKNHNIDVEAKKLGELFRMQRIS